MANQSLKLPYIVVTGVVVAGLLIIVVLLRPLLGDSLRLNANRQAQLLVRDERSLFLKTLDIKTAELRAQAAREKELTVSLPEDDAIDDVLRLLGSLADQTGIVITRATNQSDRSAQEARARQARGDEAGLPAGIIPLSASVEVSGSYAQLRAFLDQIERAPRLIDVTAIDLRTHSVTPDTLTGDLSLTFYSYSELISHGSK